MEGPDEVLALREVDRGLAADRGVDLREQRGGDLDERHAAEVRRGEEPGRVTERTPADRDERLGPLFRSTIPEPELAARIAMELDLVGTLAVVIMAGAATTLLEQQKGKYGVNIVSNTGID
jgi:hypothetical protein